MNSLYGKTIQKQVDYKIVYKEKGNEIANYVRLNHNSIMEITELEDSDIIRVKKRQSV